MKTLIALLLLTVIESSFAQSLTGAWELKGDQSTESRIYAGNFFSVAIYNLEGKQFVGTYGGKYAQSGDQLTETIEFDTRNPERVGTEVKAGIKLSKNGKKLTIGSTELNRSDDGTPGQLSGAWLITGRFNDKGEVRRSTPGARRTMKILSGTRFQWIAYNVETKEFSGTGGGTYTTKDGKYTETIAFFSRDNTRVGASLGFDYSLVEGEWHHTGLSSKGEPIHEIWTKREKIGL
jgi:hypothetical protein